MSYATYRALDELWLTNIPSHWDSRKIKYLFSERVEKGHPDEPLLVASQNMGVVPKGVYGSRTVEATKDLHNLKLVRIGDFVISLRSFQGGIEYAYYQGIISPAYTVMIPNSYITSGYFRYLAKSRFFIELLQMCVTGIREGQNIDYGKLKNHVIPLPPKSEQDQIVRFLDWKVSAINKFLKLIYGKPSIDPIVLESYSKSLLALLIEYRTRLISDAVTGTLDVRDVEVPEYEAVGESVSDDIDEFDRETINEDTEESQ
jgi:type I restriction enzyme S subunit